MAESVQITDLIIKGLTFGTGAVVAILAANTFIRNGKIERSKWLNQLHEKFFEKENYIQIRKALDYNNTPNKDYVALKAAVDSNSDEHEDLQEKFVNYLNFFEYVATLWKTGQIKVAEVHMLFGYYLTNIEKHQWIKDFAAKNQFKNLPALIEAVNKENNKK